MNGKGGSHVLLDHVLLDKFKCVFFFSAEGILHSLLL